MKFRAIVLIHLGTPRDFSEAAAKEFLREFLSDSDVMRVNFLLRYFLSKRIAAKRAGAYAQKLNEFAIGGKMQLNYYAGNIAAKLEARLKIPVRTAGTYGAQNIEKAVRDLENIAGRDILFIPLYPQYSSATTLPVVKKILKLGFSENQIVKNYFDEPLYIDALAQSVKSASANADLLLGSFHSLPLDTPQIGDYMIECSQTIQLLTESLGGIRTGIAWQSAMGDASRWVAQLTKDGIAQFVREGIERIAVICPGFFCDCLETAVDIEIDLRKSFLECGGKSFVYINGLNDSSAHIALFEKIYNERNSG